MASKSYPSLYLYHQILMSFPKCFNISRKDGFTQQKKTLFKRNTKDTILEGRWIVKWIIAMTQNFMGTFWWWEELVVARQHFLGINKMTKFRKK